jgi:ComF family protein
MGEGVRPFERMVRLGTFTDPIKHLVHQMKYHRRWSLAEFFADRLIDQERVKGLLTETDVIIPVPLYPLRQMLRGYNQAEEIARRLAKRCGFKFSKAAIRLKNTETQTHLSQAARAENLRNAFAVTKQRAIRGKHVVLVDDVTTTGATLVSLAKELLNAEPASLSAITIAIADPKGRGFEQI